MLPGILPYFCFTGSFNLIFFPNSPPPTYCDGCHNNESESFFWYDSFYARPTPSLFVLIGCYNSRVGQSFCQDQGLTTPWDDQLSYILTPALAAYETERVTGNSSFYTSSVLLCCLAQASLWISEPGFEFVGKSPCASVSKLNKVVWHSILHWPMFAVKCTHGSNHLDESGFIQENVDRQYKKLNTQWWWGWWRLEDCPCCQKYAYCAKKQHTHTCRQACTHTHTHTVTHTNKPHKTHMHTDECMLTHTKTWTSPPKKKNKKKTQQQSSLTVHQTSWHNRQVIICVGSPFPGVTAGNEEFQDAVRQAVPEGQTFKGYPIQFTHRNARKAFLTCLK